MTQRRAHGRAPEPNIPVRIERGSLRDYDALAHHHYLAGRPAVPVLTLRAVGFGALAGVLVVAMPTLNGVWRDLAWPGRYTSGDKKQDAARLNREVRTIARVVVDPRFRGVGVAHRLVRAYLDNPLTAATEAVASMGRASGFFGSAGMTAYEIPIDPRDARLGDALHARGSGAWELIDPARRKRLLRDRLVAQELRTWGRARRVNPNDPLLAERAAQRLLSDPLAYAHTSEVVMGSGKERVPRVRTPKTKEELGHTLTFFLARRDRNKVLRKLRAYAEPREVALMRALGIDREEQ